MSWEAAARRDFIDFYNHRRYHEGLDKRDAGGCLLRAARLQPTPSQLSVAQALQMRQWLQIAASMGLENGPDDVRVEPIEPRKSVSGDSANC